MMRSRVSEVIANPPIEKVLMGSVNQHGQTADADPHGLPFLFRAQQRYLVAVFAAQATLGCFFVGSGLFAQ